MPETVLTIDALDPTRNLYVTVQQEVDLGVQALQSENGDIAVTLFQSSLKKLSPGQPFYDHLVHNLLLGYKLLIDQLLQSGETDAAEGFLGSALSLEISGEMAGDEEFRRLFASGFEGLGLSLFQRRHFRASVLCFRKAHSIYPMPGTHVNLTNALAMSGLPAHVSDYAADINPEDLGRHIFIACVPKSASTFLKNLLVGLTGFRDVFMVYAAGQTEHELYLPTVLEAARADTVTQQHCRASDANVQMMQAFGIRPVVLVRNIFDSVMSLLDFYNSGAFYNTYHRADFQGLDREAQIDLLIDNAIPWYFQFVASWDLVEKQRRLDILWLTYEELTRTKAASVAKVLEFYGLGAPVRAVEQKIRETESEKRKTRFNKGVAGRGESGLSDLQKERIRSLARFYPSTDFGRVGL